MVSTSINSITASQSLSESILQTAASRVRTQTEVEESHLSFVPSGRTHNREIVIGDLYSAHTQIERSVYHKGKYYTGVAEEVLYAAIYSCMTGREVDHTEPLAARSLENVMYQQIEGALGGLETEYPQTERWQRFNQKLQAAFTGLGGSQGVRDDLKHEIWQMTHSKYADLNKIWINIILSSMLMVLRAIQTRCCESPAKEDPRCHYPAVRLGLRIRK
jgi:hypothetical protein